MRVADTRPPYSRARNKRFRESDIFGAYSSAWWRRASRRGFVGGEGFAIDASLIIADANKQRWMPAKDWDKNRDPETASRAVWRSRDLSKARLGGGKALRTRRMV